jgi:hypothetical protein
MQFSLRFRIVDFGLRNVDVMVLKSITILDCGLWIVDCVKMYQYSEIRNPKSEIHNPKSKNFFLKKNIFRELF